MKECLMTVRQATETALRNKGIKKNNSKNKVGKDWSFERCKNGKYSKSESKRMVF